ncbi:4a-hydroxytetrahydrobiopterin dehydratase [Nocardia sp. CNY236]|uniref:4a-hydroxytetrahydrobiopterin dehydratase n=1 Tax=Nocardia sp. CNY236 TaxID=1169152 RepID=UPI0003F5994B|nr:4a-hydroxytetrahydrobiopterin dehydratase [Nocardia sp. CNY236]
MAQQTLLSDTEITEALTELPTWTRSGDTLVRVVKAPSFPAGIDLVRRVAEAAEEADHHPDIDIRWRTITFAVSTHFAGGITALDIALARRIDSLVAHSDRTT